MYIVQTTIAWAVKKVHHVRAACVTTRCAVTAIYINVTSARRTIARSVLLIVKFVILICVNTVMNLSLVIAAIGRVAPVLQSGLKRAKNVRTDFAVVISLLHAKHVIRLFVRIAPTYVRFAKIVFVTNAAISPLALMMFVIK